MCGDWRTEDQELSSITAWGKASAHLGDHLLFKSLRSMSLSKPLCLSVNPIVGASKPDGNSTRFQVLEPRIELLGR